MKGGPYDLELTFKIQITTSEATQSNPITLISKQVDASQGGDGSNLFDGDGQMKHEVNFCAPSRVKNLLDPPNRDVGIHF